MQERRCTKSSPVKPVQALSLALLLAQALQLLLHHHHFQISTTNHLRLLGEMEVTALLMLFLHSSTREQP